jgi:hypothetical protein
MVALVDISGEVHLLTPGAAAAGLRGESRYVAVREAGTACGDGRSRATLLLAVPLHHYPRSKVEIGSATVKWYPQSNKPYDTHRGR